MLEKKVFMAMSGGVDSSVAALLLKKRGYQVIGIFMRCYNLDGCAEKDVEDARRTAEKIGIPFYAWDFEKEYKEKVVEYMIEEYKKGLTPNPDVMCNKEIKFGLFLEKALAMGADYVATGHYVRLKKIKNPAFGEVFEESRVEPRQPGLVPIKQNTIADLNLSNIVGDNSKRRGPAGNQTPETQIPTLVSAQPGPTAYSLYQAKDANKDQSYFLWTLTQNQLQYCLFPIGNYLKSEVRRLAKKAGLPTAEKKDSQGICFLGKITLKDFLVKRLPPKKGKILNAEKKQIGVHEGAHFFTIGQRHGLGISSNKPLGEPLYISEKNIKANTVTLVEGENNPALYKKEIELRDMNFILPSLTKRKSAVLCRVRYRQPLAEAVLISGSKTLLIFRKPQKFIAPGQSAVLYSRNGAMLGGGIILSAN